MNLINLRFLIKYLFSKENQIKEQVVYMSKVKIISVIYTLGILIGAIFLGVWDAETKFIKTIGVFIWTIIFLIALFFADQNEKK